MHTIRRWRGEVLPKSTVAAVNDALGSLAAAVLQWFVPRARGDKAAGGDGREAGERRILMPSSAHRRPP